MKDRKILSMDIGLSVLMFAFIYLKTYMIFQSVEYGITIAVIVSLMDRVIYLFFVIFIAYSAIFIMRLFHIGQIVKEGKG